MYLIIRNIIHIFVSMKKDLGKYLLDISKLVFGGVILAGIMSSNVNKWVLFLIGGVVCIITLLFGLRLVTTKDKEV